MQVSYKDKVVKYCKKNKLEFKKNQGGGINVYVPWENKAVEKYLQRIKSKYKVMSDSNFDYRIYIIS